MLWHKAWLETRWRFLIGLAVMVLAACGIVFEYPGVKSLMPLARNIEATVDTNTMLGRLIKEGAELQSTYRGFVWWQWVRQNFLQMWTLFAVLIGSGGLISKGAAPLFTLSLPVSRSRLVGVRAALGLAELLVLAVVPSLIVPLLSPAVGQSYSLVDALVYSACMFVGGAVFFCLAFLLSTVFGDLWRPLLATCLIAVGLSIGEGIVRESGIGIFRVMNGQLYFRTGSLPWLGLMTSMAASAALLFAANRNVARQDF